LELPETDGKHAQSSADGMTGKMGTRPIIIEGQYIDILHFRVKSDSPPTKARTKLTGTS